jgi:hypothetical protein
VRYQVHQLVAVRAREIALDRQIARGEIVADALARAAHQTRRLGGDPLLPLPAPALEDRAAVGAPGRLGRLGTQAIGIVILLADATAGLFVCTEGMES